MCAVPRRYPAKKRGRQAGVIVGVVVGDGSRLRWGGPFGCLGHLFFSDLRPRSLVRVTPLFLGEFKLSRWKKKKCVVNPQWNGKLRCAIKIPSSLLSMGCGVTRVNTMLNTVALIVFLIFVRTRR